MKLKKSTEKLSLQFQKSTEKLSLRVLSRDKKNQLEKCLASSIVNQDWEEILRKSTNKQLEKYFIGNVFKTLTALIYKKLFDEYDQKDKKFSALIIYLDKSGVRIKSKIFNGAQEVQENLEKKYKLISESILNKFDFTSKMFLYLQQDRQKKPFIVEYKRSGKNSSQANEILLKDKELDLVEFNINHKVVVEYPNKKPTLGINYDESKIIRKLRDFSKFKESTDEVDHKTDMDKYFEKMDIFVENNIWTLIPLWLGPNLNPVPIGSILISTSKPLEEFQIRKVIRIARENLSPIRTFEFFSEIIKHSKKSAVAAIMSRNMSHNIGSHILSILKQELKLKEKTVGRAVKYEIDEKVLDNAYLNGISYLINYLQERQDFIATVSGFEYQNLVPISFKEFIYDGFLPDKKYERHRDIKQLALINHILENISKSETITRDKIEIRFRKFDGTNQTKGASFEVLKDLVISVPAGILGRQAFFSIFENIIRNSAKHSEIKDNKLIITIDTPHLEIVRSEEQKNEYQILKVNGSDGEPIRYEYDPKEFVLFSITDNLHISESNLIKIRNGINEDLVNSFGEIKPENKGLKEMKISAGWLRDIQPDKLDNKYTHPPILLAERTENENLCYYFFVKKPKEILLIIDDNLNRNLKEKEYQRELSNWGVDVCTVNDIKYFSHLNHQLNIVQDVLKEQFQQKLSEFILNKEATLNNRICFFETSKIIEILSKVYNKDNYIELLSDFWDGWIKSSFPHFNNSFDNKIYIQDIEDYQAEFKNSKQLNNFVYCTDIELSTITPKILIKIHNDTELYFKQNRDELNKLNKFSELYFIEGISGGNSTDLYYRKTPKTKLHYYKLLESVLSKVLVLDERIWEKITDVSVNEVIFYDYFINNKIDDIKGLLGCCTTATTEKDFESELMKLLNVPLTIPLTGQLFQKKNDVDEMYQFLEDRFNKIQKNIKADVFDKKGYEVLNIFYNSSSKTFQFYDTKLNQVGKFSDNGEVSFNKNLFSIITIHQGILDKIHDKFSMSVNSVCQNITESFPSVLVKAIHSGRSRPVSLPSHTSFIPYASLENSFYDSKYTLTSLFFNSKNH